MSSLNFCPHPFCNFEKCTLGSDPKLVRRQYTVFNDPTAWICAETGLYENRHCCLYFRLHFTGKVKYACNCDVPAIQSKN